MVLELLLDLVSVVAVTIATVWMVFRPEKKENR